MSEMKFMDLVKTFSLIYHTRAEPFFYLNQKIINLFAQHLTSQNSV